MNNVCERKVLESANLAEAFDILIEALKVLKSQGITFLVNGAVNLSRLAYEAGVTGVYPADGDYTFARFINPYSVKTNNCIAVSVEVEKGKENSSIEIAREVFNKSGHKNTLLAIQTNFNYKEVKNVYDKAKENGKSVLDITFNPSTELLHFAEAVKKVKTDVTSIDGAVYNYIKNNPIKLIDNSTKYFQAFRKLNVKDIESVAFAVTLVNTNEILYDEIIDFVMGNDGLIYQEQAIAQLSKLSGCSHFYADNIRSAVVKNNINLLNGYKTAFLYGGKDVTGEQFVGCNGNGCLSQGIEFWDEFNELAPYLYLKAHAVARAGFYLNCAKTQI